MPKELTKMRTEMLGTAYTAQHSDCRVLEQLLLGKKTSYSKGGADSASKQ